VSTLRLVEHRFAQERLVELKDEQDEQKQHDDAGEEPGRAAGPPRMWSRMDHFGGNWGGPAVTGVCEGRLDG
jgi:hypothetical protein